MIDQPTFTCVVERVADADTLKCRNRIDVRIAGVNAREADGTCNAYPCPEMRHEQAQPIVSRMVLGKALRCRAVGVNYRRTVAVCALPDGRDLGCAIIATGAGNVWAEYWARYGLPECGERSGG